MTTDFFYLNDYYFRELSEKDVTNKYLNWLDDSEVTRFLEIRHTSFNFEKLNLYVESFNKDESKYLFGVFSNKNNKHIGNVTIYNIVKSTSSFNIGYLIGDKNYWGSTTSSTILLFAIHFGFDNLGLEKFIAGVYSNHSKPRFTLKKIGCFECGRIKNKLLSNNKLVDQVFYCLNIEQWKSIKLKHDLSIF